MAVEPKPEAQKSIQQLSQELKRLKVKRSESTDSDIRDALQKRIEALEGQVADQSLAVTADAEPEIEESIPLPPSPEQDLQAESLIRQARVETMRKNTAVATSLLEQAEKVAPGSVLVLELLADQLVLARRLDAALKKYAIALRIDPNNLSIAKKHADLVFRVKAQAAGIELAQSMGNENFNGNPKKMVYVTAIIPGLGHILLGDFVTGYSILVLWIVTSVWSIAAGHNLKGFLGSLGIGQPTPNQSSGAGALILPLILGTAVYIYALFSCKKLASKQNVPNFTSSGVRPPVDLPF